MPPLPQVGQQVRICLLIFAPQGRGAFVTNLGIPLVISMANIWRFVTQSCPQLQGWGISQTTLPNPRLCLIWGRWGMTLTPLSSVKTPMWAWQEVKYKLHTHVPYT